MPDMNDFLNSTKAEKGMNLVKHNETDYDSFNAFQRRMDRKNQEQQAKEMVVLRERALKVWEEVTPARWRDASLETINNKAARDVKSLIEADGVSNFFVKGVAAAGKTYLAHAIARKYIELGKVRPTKVYFSSEADFLASAREGFGGHSEFSKIFKAGYTMFILDDVGQLNDYTTAEMTRWGRLFDHVFSNSIPIVLTSSGSAANFATLLSKTASAKFVQLVPKTHLIEMKRDGRIAPDVFDDWTSEEVSEVTQKENLGKRFSPEARRNPNRK